MSTALVRTKLEHLHLLLRTTISDNEGDHRSESRTYKGNYETDRIPTEEETEERKVGGSVLNEILFTQ